MPTHDVLARLQHLAEQLRRAPHNAAAHLLHAMAHEIESSAALMDALNGRPEQVADWIRADAPPPSDLAEWGRDAAALLLRARKDVQPGRSFDHTVRRLVDGPLRTLSDAMRWQSGSDAGRDVVVAWLVEPLLTWAEITLGAFSGFSVTVRRWTVRVQAFGLPGQPPRREVLANPSALQISERALQLDLSRFLFDQGFDLGQHGRELLLRERPGQAAKVDFLLRDRHTVAVELVLIRDTAELAPVRTHAHQLLDYCRTANARYGMLVVVNADAKRRLAVTPRAATAPAGVRVGEVHFAVCIADLMVANASEDAARPLRTADLDLPLEP